jgi:hypothetical protein
MLEKLSKIAHESWAGWTKYFFEKGVKNADGTITIPKWGVERWERQIKTDYKDLSEKEKESDRTEAHKYISVIKQWNLVSEIMPLAFDTGEWDGKKSDKVIVEDNVGKKYLATYYEGFMDGSHFKDWYDERDNYINNEIIKWYPIPE